jgi:CheY-like chemotaxis protein
MVQSQPEFEQVASQESKILSVGLVGFQGVDQESFLKYFSIERPDKRKYVAASPSQTVDSDILIVNYDNPAALTEEAAIVAKRPNIQIVAVSRGPLSAPPLHHIRGMLFAARVLTTLDKVEVDSPVLAEVSVKPDVVDKSDPQASGYKPELVSAKELPTEVVPVESKTGAGIQPEPVSPAIAKDVAAETAEPAGPASAAITPPVIVPDATVKEGYRVLVVDDSLAIQKSLEIHLSGLSQIGTIDFADDGESAIEKADLSQYDLIFLDVMMPGIDGYEACTQLRKKPEYKKTPIIMVSGKTSPLDEVKGVMAGCTTYLTKPVQPEAFQKLSVRVMTWLDKQKKA